MLEIEADELAEIGSLARKMGLMAKRLEECAVDCSEDRVDAELLLALTSGVDASVANIAQKLQYLDDYVRRYNEKALRGALRGREKHPPRPSDYLEA
jgi:hypothetical protein